MKVVNIIATAKIKGTIDVLTLVDKTSTAEYNPEIFSGLVIRNKPEPTIIVFETGRVSSHGSKNEKDAKQAILRAIDLIKEKGCLVGSKELEWLRIENVVAVGSLKACQRIDLERLYSTLRSSIYEPEQFPGLIHRPLGNNVTCLIFSSAKIVTVGGKSERQVQDAFEKMTAIIEESGSCIVEEPEGRVLQHVAK